MRRKLYSVEKNCLIMMSSLLQTDNVEMVNRELINLDNLFVDYVSDIGRLRDGIEDEVKLVELSDADVFEVKQKVSNWMIVQAEADAKSNSSRVTLSPPKDHCNLTILCPNIPLFHNSLMLVKGQRLLV